MAEIERKFRVGRGRCVLLVVGVQNEDAIECARDDRIDCVGLARHREAHLQEIRRVVEIVSRIDEGLSDRVLVGHCRDRRHLGNHAVACYLALPRIVEVSRVVIEGGQRADHDRHRVRVAPVTGVNSRHLLVHHRVVRFDVAEPSEFLVARKLAMEEQIAGGEEVGVLRELINGVSTVEQLTLVAVDIGNGTRAVGRRREARIVGEATGVAVEITDVDHVGPDGAAANRQLGHSVIVSQRRSLGCTSFAKELKGGSGSAWSRPEGWKSKSPFNWPRRVVPALAAVEELLRCEMR
jgi:hypothetical protein